MPSRKPLYGVAEVKAQPALLSYTWRTVDQLPNKPPAPIGDAQKRKHTRLRDTGTYGSLPHRPERREAHLDKHRGSSLRVLGRGREVLQAMVGSKVLSDVTCDLRP